MDTPLSIYNNSSSKPWWTKTDRLFEYQKGNLMLLTIAYSDICPILNKDLFQHLCLWLLLSILIKKEALSCYLTIFRPTQIEVNWINFIILILR